MKEAIVAEEYFDLGHLPEQILCTGLAQAASSKLHLLHSLFKIERKQSLSFLWYIDIYSDIMNSKDHNFPPKHKK